MKTRRARTQAKPERTQGAPRSALVSLWDWRAANPHLFPSDTSLRWHLRKHRDKYVASGALLEVAGRFVCDPQKMELTLREVGAYVAAERTVPGGRP
jgi:hypothetical protein